MTKGWTEADVIAHMARILRGRTERPQDLTNGASGIPLAQNKPDALKSTARGLLGLSQTVAISDKRHKYRAEPCIVTPDFTLFTKADITAIEAQDPASLRTGSLKQRAARVSLVGEWFGSTKEGRRYIALRQLETAGEIFALELQVKFPLWATNTLDQRTVLGEYRADFTYRLAATPGPLIVEDVKGVKTALYEWKARHVSAQYGITIRET